MAYCLISSVQGQLYIPGIGITAFLISFFPTAISLHGNIRIPGFIYCPGLVSPQTRARDTITVPLTTM
jgi:hypothetical protein